MKSKIRFTAWLVPAAGVISLALSLSTSAQVDTKTTVNRGTPTKEVKVERGTVVAVSGNDLVVQMEDGQIRHFPNIPDSTRITVDGQQLGIHDLKPGMKLERTITTTETPKTVTTVQSVTGTVFQVIPPLTVILTMEDGKNQQFKIPKDQKFTVNGKETDAFGLRKGMRVSATRIVEVPETVIAQQRKVTGTMPPPPPPPPADVPILVVAAVPVAQPPAVADSEAASKLPKTGSSLPLIGLLGVLSLAMALWIRVVRIYR
jgi:LPXTG-motif cell wall-anchored protein